MSTRPCRDCGTTEGVRSYGLCQPCGFARGVAERAAQGLGPHCTHGPTLERIATLMGVDRDEPKPATAWTTAPAPAATRAPRRTSDGTAAAPATTRSTRRRAAAGTKNSGTTEVALHDAAAPDFAAS